MIEVINREILIPREEYNIGTCYDDNTETRHFHLKRVTSSGIDLAALTFNLDIKYANGQTDAASLLKEVTDKDINLTLTIGNSMLQVPGTVIIQIRALEEDGTCKWTSYQSNFFVEDHINTPGHYQGDLTQLEQYEAEWGKVRDNVNQLNSRMDEVVKIHDETPATEVEEEVIDGRVGYNGTQYDSLGTAIRQQIIDVREDMEEGTADWTEALAAETTARQAADTTLQGNINTEASVRANAITAEATARQAAIDAETTARTAADATLQGNINTEASTRAAQDSSLQSQINEIIAPSGEAPSAAEVQNIRIGANGTTYSSAGDAVRGQYTELHQGLMNAQNGYSGPRVLNGTETKLSEMLLNGVYRLERADVQRLTDLPNGAKNNETSTLVNQTNFYSVGNFTLQSFYQLDKKVWNRLITKDGGTVYIPWFRADGLEHFQARSVPSGTTRLASLVELGVYNIPTSTFDLFDDKPVGAIRTTYTMIALSNAYNGQFTIQILISTEKEFYCRVVITETKAVYIDWFLLYNSVPHYKEHDLPSGTTALSELREPGSYNIVSALYDQITDWPDGSVRGTYTLFNITKAFAGHFIIQRLYTVDVNEWYQRVIQSDGTVYRNWESSSTNNGIVYAAIGDSRTQKTDAVNVAYPDVVRNIKGYKTAYNWGIGGSTYVKITERTSAYEICSAHSFANVDVVSMCWGFNDYGRSLPIGTPGDTDDTTVCGAIYKCLNKIYTDNPKCAVFVFTPLPNKGIINNESARAAFVPYVNAIIATCEKYGVAVFNSENGGLPLFVVDSFFDYDDTHSTDYTVWGTWIASHLP